jgi:fluoroacetyl-CoA thioesterase
MEHMRTGERTTREFTVTDGDTAAALRSGDLPVLATPRLLAWCEATTCAALHPSLPGERTSVGTRIRLDHVGASPVGAVVRVTASPVHVDGRLVRFEVVAEHVGPEPKVIGQGEVTRIVVDRKRFLARI